jgi:beta-lactamase class A
LFSEKQLYLSFMRKYICIFITLACAPFCTAQKDLLRAQLNGYIRQYHATIGVGIYDMAANDTLIINESHEYPTMSVYKFHLALAVLHAVDEGTLTLDQKIQVTADELHAETWSPLRDKYPQGATLPLSEIIRYTVAESDNNGCDILFRLMGGTRKVQRYIRSLGLKKISIKATEEEMHRDWDDQFSNWTTPYGAVWLLERFYRGHILSETSTRYLWELLCSSPTGPNRLKGLLPENVVIGHKTGTSGADQTGMTIAVNDIGIIQRPDGKLYTIAVFVSSSSETFDTNEQIIATISKMVWEHMGGSL